MASSAGSEAVDLAKSAGILLDEWQCHVLEVALGERPDGSWSALEVGLIVPRQNGKNEILAARELAGIVLFGDDLITHTAHRADTTLEQFRKMEQLAEECDDFGRLVKRVSRVNGHEALELKGGRRIRFVSRQRSPGRGFSGSVVVFDEAFDLPAGVIGALVPTLSTRPMAQVWYTSSPPKSTSAVLHGVRRRGRAGDGERLAYFEWGNDAGVATDDRDAQYRANPALGVRISEDFIDAERELMSSMPEEFLREVMGVAEEPVEEGLASPLTGVWASLVDAESRVATNHQFGFDVSPDRQWASFAVAGRRADGLLHVETVERRPGTGWAVARAVELHKVWSQPVRIDKSGPAGSFVSLFQAAGVAVVELTASDHARAAGLLIDAALNGELRHLGQQTLDIAVRHAELRASGDADRWERRKSDVDISPLVAATLALSGVPVTGGEPLVFAY